MSNIGQRLSITDIEAKIVTKQFKQFGKKTTVCHITTESGFEIVGAGYCFDETTFDVAIGQEMAYREALNKLIEAEAYAQTKENWKYFKDSHKE